MADGFDPYYTWLGIPPDEQPPTHYRLLGLRVFEDHVEAIQNAADRQMAYLRTFQTGPHSPLSQRLLNEVAAARVCLSNPEKKTAYDAMLWQKMQPSPAPAIPVAPAAPPPATDQALNHLFESFQTTSSSSPATTYSRGQSRKVQQNLWILGSLACLVVVLLMGIWLWSPAPSTPKAPPEQEQFPSPPVATQLIVLWPEGDRRDGKLVIDKWIHEASSLTEGSDATRLVIDVDPGKHQLRLHRPGFKPVEETVFVEEGQQRQIEPSWQALGATTASEEPNAATPASTLAPATPTMAASEIAQTAEPKNEPSESQTPKSEPEQPAGDQPAMADAKPEPPAPAAPSLSEFAPAKPESVKRQPVPDEAAQARALASVKQLFAKEYGANQTHARLGLAARLIRHARESRDEPAEQYVLLNEARGLAERQGDAALALLVIDELTKRFEMSGAEMRREALALSLRHSQTPATLAMIAELALQAAEASLADGEYQAWSTLFGQIKGAASKKGGSPLAQAIDEQQKRLETLQGVYPAAKAAAKALEQAPGDPGANLELGRFYCLAKGDWDKGLPLLAKGSQGPLPPLAAKLAAQRDDVATQLAMADVWYSLASKERGGMKLLVTGAANYWYEQAMPRLTGLDLARVEERLAGETGTGRETRAKAPFRISLHGLGGLPAMTPSKVTGNVVPADGFAALQGRCRLEYAQIPASAYIQQLEFTFASSSGSLNVYYGDPHEGARLNLWWDDEKKKVACRLYCYRGGWRFWGGQRDFEPQTRLRFTLYVSDSRHSLFEGDRGILGCGGHPADLFLRIHTGDKTAVTIHRCDFRRWTSADAQRLRWPMPPSKIEANWGETAMRLYQRNLELRERPILADKKPFVIATTGTAMEWVEPGKYQRPVGKDGKQSCEISISRGFWIGRYELTQGEWASLVPVNPSRVTGSPFLPVDGMTYEDAAKFCLLLNQQETKARRLPNGYVYRLPTEGEWEHACRAGAKEDFSVDPGDFWWDKNSGWRSHEVGEGKPNAWGLYDMHGNLGEWCLDAWRDEPETPVWRQTDPFTPPQSTTGLFPARGGAWWAGRDACTSRSREVCHSVPGGHRGFRLVLGPALQGGK